MKEEITLYTIENKIDRLTDYVKENLVTKKELNKALDNAIESLALSTAKGFAEAKADIKELRGELRGEFRSGIKEVKDDIEHAETRLSRKIDASRLRLDNCEEDIAEMKTRLKFS